MIRVALRGDGRIVLEDERCAFGEDVASPPAFEAAVMAASLALREGHEVQISAPSHDASGATRDVSAEG